MQLQALADVELTYRSIQLLDFAPGGRIYGTMEGSVTGERLTGTLHLTNLAERRPDNVNLPTLRGVLVTDDEADIWVELDGLASLRESDQARVFVTSFRFQTGDQRYAWLNTTYAILEGVLGAVAVDGLAHGTLHICIPTIS